MIERMHFYGYGKYGKQLQNVYIINGIFLYQLIVIAKKAVVE